MKKILASALSAISPSGEELSRELAFAHLLVSHIQGNLQKGCEAVLTGSMAKKTFLRDKRDIDIFVLFQRSVPRGELEPSIKRIMAAAFPNLGYQLSYAEHPYARFHFEGRKVDLVPAYRIGDASERLSAVDRSVLHTKFVTRALKKSRIGGVLLLKQLLRANGLYGAEIRVEGFSGYLCELLIIKYKSFPALMRAASKWKAPLFIDIKKFYKPKDIPQLRKALNSPFIVIDPTDRSRNVAAAVSKENLARFIALCRAFLKKPSGLFFFRKAMTFEEGAARAAKGCELFMLSMPRPDVVDDVLWGQLRKMVGQLEAQLSDYSPKAILADDSRHLVRLAIILRKGRLSDRMLVAGPPLSMKKNVLDFRKSHRRAKFIVKRKKLFADVKRPLVRAEDSIHSFFRAFSKTKSHLAYPEEMLIIERRGGEERRKGRRKGKP